MAPGGLPPRLLATPFRSRRSESALTVGSIDDLGRLVDEENPSGEPVRLQVTDIDMVRHLAIPRSGELRTDDIKIRLEYWEPPVPRWRGRIAHLRSVRDVALHYDPARRSATVHVTLYVPAPVSEIANALIPALTPDSAHSGAGFPLIAVAQDAGDAVLQLLPGRRVPAVEPIVPLLDGVGLNRSDVLLVGSSDAPIEQGDATTSLEIGEALRGTPRTPAPVIDLNVHNPIGRTLSFKESPPARRLIVDGDAGVALLHADDRDEFPAVELPLTSPLSLAATRELRDVESVDLSRLDSQPSSGILSRLIEIAATGVVLHSMPEQAADELARVSPTIAQAARSPYRQCLGLERERRSVALRRAAMLEHGGFFRLASAIQGSTGHRYLPRVSVILSSMRPDLIPGVLRMMAKQTYPHFEVVVVMHGVPSPDLSAVADNISGLHYTIVEVGSDKLFGAALAEGVRRSSGDLITKLDDDDWYSEHHLSDLVLAHLYSRADVVGKTTEYLYFEEVDQTVHRSFATERYHDQVAGGAMLLSRATFDELGGWRPTPNSTDRSVLVRVETQGGIAYRTHGLGYAYIRRPSKHTWVRTESQLLNGSFEQWRGWRAPEV